MPYYYSVGFLRYSTWTKTSKLDHKSADASHKKSKTTAIVYEFVYIHLCYAFIIIER